MVHQPNPVQAISQQRQQFAIGGGPQPLEQPRPVDDLAEEIYARLVAGQYLVAGYFNVVIEEDQLRKLAQASQSAATAYFSIRANQEKANG